MTERDITNERAAALYDVFVSFRGGDRESARRIREGLTAHSGARVFHDERSIPAGARWSDYIDGAARRSRSMVAVIGPAWGLLERTAAIDWVRRELEIAVTHGIPILPVIVGDPKLRERLADLPEAFTAQAIVVDAHLPAHQIELILVALSRLGVSGVQPHSADLRLSSRTIKTSASKALAAVDSGHVLMIGAPGSGRSRLLVEIASQLSQHPGAAIDDLVVGGRRRPIESAARYSLVTNWFGDIAAQIRNRELPDATARGHALSALVLAKAQLLVQRAVLPTRLLLDLANGVQDRAVVKLVRDGNDLGLTTPRNALVDQAVTLMCEGTRALGKKRLVLLVDDIDQLDTGSRMVLDRVASASTDVRVLGTAPKGRSGNSSWSRTEIEIATTKQVGLAGLPATVDLANGRDRLESIEDDYVRTLTLRYLVSEHAVLDPDSRGRLTISVPPESTTLTPGHLVRWATEQRFADRARAALRAAALMKEPFAFDVAFAAANDDVTEDEIAEAWAGIPITDRDGLILRPLVSEAGLRRARFSHPIVREALQEELPIGDRPHTHRRIADQTERRMAESRDDLRITAWEAIGRHRALSGEHWLAAEAYRVAGRLAEESVAFSAAVRNYRNATNELSRALLAAETKRNEADLLLLLANTAYRLARLEPDDADPAECGEPDVDNIRDAEGYLSTLDDEFAALEAELRGQPVADPRDRSRVPQVDPTHHTRRLRHAISGYLSFLSYRDAEGLKGTPDEQRALLEILQHAEEAQAEGNATWLLAAASVQYARSLIVEADDLARGEGAALVRRERRLLEAFFHIERTLGLSPPTPDAVVNDPLCWARSVRSKLCEHLAPATKVAAYLVGCTSTVSTVRFEAVVWDLAQCRLTPDGLQHARNVQRRSLDLLHIYRHQLTDEDTIALERDLSIAAALHDWYSDIDASKLLTLAREWHLTINGAEWANPVLLHGRLAVEVARRQYGAAERLGAERFARIEAMVSNHTLGVANASFGERIFFIADSPCDLVGGAARSKDLDEHYRAAVKQKADTAFSDGRLMIVR